jgi:hypothetical protein
MRGMKTATRMKRRKWARYALPEGFAECGYTKDSSYHTTSKNYDGSQEPKLWLSDYLHAVQILRGSRTTLMQSLQLHLTSAARSWLSMLPDDSIESWGELENQFTRNFRSTYKRPTSIEVKSCMWKKGKALRSYIQRWSIIIKTQHKMSPTREQ